MNKTMKKLWALCGVLLVTLPFLTACGQDDANEIVLVNPFVGADSQNF